MDIYVQRPVITLEFACEMLKAALAKANELEKLVSIAIVDEGGNLVAFNRMTGAVHSSSKVAIDKAFTAACTRISTHKWFETLETDAPLRLGAAAGMERLITFGGGQPIIADGHVIGGIGVSGAHWAGDTEIGSAALNLLMA